jgi:hypothetical protein
MVKLCRLRANIAASLSRLIAGTSVRRRWIRRACLVALAAATAATPVRAADARFDLIGPKVEVRVTRAGVTLPIASVPNLQPGDRLWLHPDLPPTQSVHYLMVLAFLRGTTNPPPDNWFIRIETWDKKVRQEGVEVTVPDEAQEAVLFLAPVTGGDFSTLRSAVQGRPGIFVRASQDLAAAGFEQARIEKYIASMRELSPLEASDPKQLQEHSNVIATTLALKPNGDCVKLPPDQQYTCLTQSGSQNLLDDGHGQTIVDALTGGATAGLIGTASSTRLAGGGVYSAYVGSIVDLVHIMGSLHTAQYQYIPAIAFPQQQSLNLRLNTPPSFHNPKSVIVIGLPSIQPTIPPPLRAADPRLVACLQKPGVVLPVEGAPLVFSTSFAHDLVLRLNYPSGAKRDPAQPQEIPLTADAFRGGLVLAPAQKRRALQSAKVAPPTSGDATAEPGSATPVDSAPNAPNSAELTGTVEGFWGFDSFTGPTMSLQDAPGKDWKLAGDDPLIAGKNQHVLISSTGIACIQSIALEPASGKQENETWKLADKPNSVDVTLDAPAHDSGDLHLAIRQFGDPRLATVSLVSYNVPAKLDALRFHAGDTTAILTGTSLDQVRQVEFGGLNFKPSEQGTGAQANAKSELRLALPADAKPPTLPVGNRLAAQVALQDGRTIRLPLMVEAARPAVTLIAKADVPPDRAPRSSFSVKLSSQDDMPVSDALMFSLKSTQPFPRAGRIEIASPDDSLHTTLSVADSNGSLILEGPATLLATLQPLKAFGPSAFGPIRLRAVAPDGSAGDWLPLVTLVRLPTLTGLSCPQAAPAVPAPPAKRSRAHRPDAPPANPDAANDAPASASSATSPDSASDASPSSVPPTAPDKTAATPAAAAPPPASCTLTGAGLYFIDAISTDDSFTNPTRIPEGFVGSSLAVPPPTGAVYYLRLRDDPTAVDTVTLPAGPL